MLILQDEIEQLRQEQASSQCSPSPAWSVSQDEYNQLESRNEELREKVTATKSYEYSPNLYALEWVTPHVTMFEETDGSN